MENEAYAILPLKELVNIYDSLRIPIKKADRKPGPYPYYGASGIADYVKSFIFDGKYLLLAEDGDNLKTRNTPIAFMAVGKFWVNNHAHILQANESADTRFLCYALQIADIKSYLSGSTRPKLTQGDMKRIPVFAPNLANQQRIAHILGTLDDKIELNRQMNETLEEMAQALFKSWFIDFDPVIDKALAAGKVIPEPLRGKAARRQALGEQRKPLPPEIGSLFPDEFVESELGWIPRGWENGTLTDLATINPSEKIPRGMLAPFVEMKAVPQAGSCISHIIKKTFSSGSRFRNDDILLARITPCLENGKTALIQCLHTDEIGHGSTEFIVLRSMHQGCIGLIYLIARDEVFREYCVNNMTGSSGRQRVAASQVAAYPMPIPPVALINYFAEKTADMFEKIGRLDEENRTLALLRDTLLPKLISGEIRVPEAEDILAEAVHE